MHREKKNINKRHDYWKGEAALLCVNKDTIYKITTQKSIVMQWSDITIQKINDLNFLTIAKNRVITNKLNYVYALLKENSESLMR